MPVSTEQRVQPTTITEHLKRYGIRTFTSDAYWDWAANRMGRNKAAKVDNLRVPLVEGEKDDPAAVRRFYEFIADPAVYGPVTSKQADDVAQALRAITEVSSGRKSILDLGCAVGHMSTWLALQESDRRVVGVDYSPRMVREATRLAAKLGIDNASFVQSDLSRAVPDGPFDAVIDAAVLQYVADLDSVLLRLREQMTADGVLVSVPQLGRARDAMPFLAALKRTGFGIRSFSFVYACDLGKKIARPLIVAGIGGESIKIDLVAEFEAVKEVLRTQRISPLCEAEAAEAEPLPI